jgi:hypothetical protein
MSQLLSYLHQATYSSRSQASVKVLLLGCCLASSYRSKLQRYVLVTEHQYFGIDSSLYHKQN